MNADIRKITTYFVVLSLSFGLIGCNSEQGMSKNVIDSNNVSSPLDEEMVNVSEMETDITSESSTEAPTEPPTEPFKYESEFYLGADISNIKSGGTVVEDENSIYFVDMSYATVWGNSEQQYSGHICKYDKETQSCSALTRTGLDEAFFFSYI